MRLKINLLLAVALFAVSTSSIFARFLPNVSAIVIAFWRLAIASILLWIYTLSQKQPKLDKDHYKYYVLSGFFLALHFSAFYSAVKLTSIANATLLGITAPVFTMLYERLFLKRTLKPIVFMGLVVAGVGTIIITGKGLISSDGSILGQMFGLLAATCISIVYIFANRLRKDTDTIAYTKFLYTIGAVFLLIFTIGSENVLSITKIEFKWLVALGIIPTILGHSIFYYSIKYTSPTIVASVPIGEPIIASIFAWFMFSEVIPLPTFIGGVFILVGIYFLVVFSPRQ
jgi:drug/metabolite transporter (DMT)-like permease